MLPLPVAIAPIPLHLSWHQRHDDDRAHAWLRAKAREVLGELDATQDGEPHLSGVAGRPAVAEQEVLRGIGAIELEALVPSGVHAGHRRGGGRSGQPWEGNNLDTYADDLGQLLEHLDLKDVALVGHSTGGGEVTRCAAGRGSARVSKLLLLSAIPPLMLKTDANPEGLPLEVFDEIRKGLLTDRSQFYEDLSAQFYGADRKGNQVSQGVRDMFWVWSMTVGLKGAYDCVKAFSETDLTEDLKRLAIPTLIIHGDDDQIVPIVAAAKKSINLVKGAELKVYEGAPHGLMAVAPFKERFNQDLLEFLAA